MMKKPWEYLVEVRGSDRDQRNKERKLLQSGTVDDWIQHLNALKRAGNGVPASFFNLRYTKIHQLVSKLNKNNALTLVFNEYFPFGEPQAVNFVVRLLENVRNGGISGLTWSSFSRFIDNWIDDNLLAIRRTSGRRFGNTALSRWFWMSDYGVEDSIYQNDEVVAQLHRDIGELPSTSDIQHLSFNLFDVQTLVNTIDSVGAISHRSSDGFLSVVFYDNERELEESWGDLLLRYAPDPEDEEEEDD